jgi:enoyl-CoA hydratase
MELALTGEPVDAPRAKELGIVNRLAEPGEALGAAHELAAQIARNAPLALSASKAIVQRAGEWTEDEAWQRQDEAVRPVFSSEDALEGARAFAEKREPRWRAR